VSDRTVSYEDYGSGPIALLVHGSPGNGKAWSRVGERLSKRYRVIAPDLPGYGETTPLPGHAEPDTADTAALLEALMETIGSRRSWPDTPTAGWWRSRWRCAGG
jgi:pimeloyl-ACP methyl ester carboxylesterase